MGVPSQGALLAVDSAEFVVMVDEVDRVVCRKDVHDRVWGFKLPLDFHAEFLSTMGSQRHALFELVDLLLMGRAGFIHRILCQGHRGQGGRGGYHGHHVVQAGAFE